MAEPKNLIFDFDGTLADTLPTYVAALYGKGVFSTNALEPAQLKRLQQMPPQKVFGYLHASPWARLRVLWFHWHQMHTVIGRAPLFAGVHEMLVLLKKQGHALYIVTSNIERNVTAFLQPKQLDGYFQDVYHVPVARKAQGLSVFVARKQLDRSRTFYIANEPADMRAAKKAGVQTIGVLWSGQDAATMKAEYPTALVDSPAELQRMFAA